MTAAIDNNLCKVVSANSSQSIRGATVNVMWYVGVTEPTAPQRVVELAQDVTADSSVGAYPVPRINDAWNDDLQFRDETFADALVFCDEIKAKPRGSGAGWASKWQIDVVYKSPNLRTLERLPQESVDPRNRDPQFWTESLVITEPRDSGKNQQAIKWPWLLTPAEPAEEGAEGPEDVPKPQAREVGELGPVTNAAGFRYGSIETIQVRLPLFCFKSFTTSPFAWIGIDTEYRKTVNKDDWDVFNTGQNVSAGTCRFYDVDTSTPLLWGDLVYYEVITRVLYNKDGHNIRVRNEGDRFWQFREQCLPDGTMKSQYVIDRPYASGIPMEPPVLLNSEGGLADEQTGAPDILFFEDLQPKDYSDLSGGLGA